MRITELQKTLFASLYHSHALQKEYSYNTLQYSTYIANEIQTILCHVLDCDRHYLLIHTDIHISEAKRNKAILLSKKRATGYPLAYLLEYCYFYEHSFIVNEHVLIPRPETEILVKLCLMLIQDLELQKKIPQCLLDCGTGSGCIAVSLAAALQKELNNNTYHIAMNDISQHALTVAKKNAQRILAIPSSHKNISHTTNTPLYAYQDTLLTKVLQKKELSSFPPGIIVANLPYVCRHELNVSCLHNEPKIALSDYSIGGSSTIKHFITQASCLKHNCIILLEFDPLQIDSIMASFAYSNFTYIQYYKDLRDQLRFIRAQNFH